MSARTGPKKVALVLHGCGVFDGSEIHEATSKAGAEVSAFAPNIQQDHVTDHSTGSNVTEKRSNFVSAGASCEVLPDVKRVIGDFVHAKKPIGLCCIAPVLAARCLPGVHVTIGTDAVTAKAIKNMGAVHENCEITGVCTDENFKVVTAPAYMYGSATIADIFDNIGLLVKRVLSLTN
ncbi:hypothetical protein TcWFU_000221 [Taenia crassiceps]|uniref:ES1 protein n=1 Tax=Taenia crassiceps TaxID=6207 RepID=A0ABR4QKQ8_9CEST